MSTMTCTECGKTDCNVLIGKERICFWCNEPKQVAWNAKMAHRMDPSQFRMQELVNCLLTSIWQHECEIIADYMPPHPRPDTRPRCVVRWRHKDGDYTYLRHSCGPLQGYSWDIYGDDMLHPELALVALSQSPPPSRVDFCVPTHGA